MRLATFCCLIAMSCGSVDDADTNTSTIKAPLIGDWQGECLPISSSVGERRFLSATSTTHTDLTRAYSDSNCTTELFYYQTVSRLVSVTGDEYDIIGTSLQLTIVDKQFATLANEQAFCEASGWETDLPKDIDGTTCNWRFAQGEKKLTFAINKATYYGAYRVEDKTLLIALADAVRDGSTKDLRPVDFSEATVLTYTVTSK